MHVQVGPLDSSGAKSWITHARGVLDGLDLEPAITEAFERYLDEWEQTAARSPEFIWIAEVDPEQTEYLAYAFHKIVQALADAAERRGYAEAPPEGEPFYQALVTSFLDALEAEGKVTAAFAEEMRANWPGLEAR